MTVSLPFDTFGKEAKALVIQSREAEDSSSSSLGSGLAVVHHPKPVEVEAEGLEWWRIAYVVLEKLAVVFLVVAVRHRTALSSSGRVGSQHRRLRVPGRSAEMDRHPQSTECWGLVWVNPVACTFMLVDFAPDYDIFPFSGDLLPFQP